jgi:excisionase family DNA binding protein
MPSHTTEMADMASTTTTTTELLLRLDAAAQRLAVSRSTLYRLIHRGDLTVIHMGSAARIPAESIDRWLATRTANSGGPQ